TRQKCAQTGVPGTHQTSNRQGYTSSAVERDPISTGGRIGAPTAEYAVGTSQTDDDDGEAEDGEDPGGEGLTSFAPGRNRTTHSGSDEPEVTVAPSGLLQSHRVSSTMQREVAHQEIESSDVAAALNRLQSKLSWPATTPYSKVYARTLCCVNED
ncbi:unnamed protein product, partial [Echinostoma caproni]|uniref:Polyprotein n=1 Tax=Echinostoma caproni TaxID=27848 RepID=A0A183A157_9TREM